MVRDGTGRADRAHRPGPRTAMSRKPQQNRAAFSPPFSIGNSAWGWWTTK
jgi:hypothetical protein